MKKNFLVAENQSFKEINIYANQSALILQWLLIEGKKRQVFALREVARETNVSLGLIQKVLKALAFQGILKIEGVRTAKTFSLIKPQQLIDSWLNAYQLIKKCHIYSYSTGYSERQEILNLIKQSPYNQKIALALHTAASVMGFQNNNLNTVELYMLDSTIQQALENLLLLEPKEKGYEVLLIIPYYKSLLMQKSQTFETLQISPPLLTYLDLYHFPLRGQEQADFMADRSAELQKMWH